MKTSPNGIEMIKKFEQFVDHLYNDQANHCTVGYGHLVHRGPTCTGTSVSDDDLKPYGITRSLALTKEAPYAKGITEPDGCILMEKDVSTLAEAPINKYVNVVMNQDEYDALASFVFNVGGGNFQTSTLLKRLNVNDRKGAALEFPKWNHAGGVVLKDLTDRRKKEVTLFRGSEAV